MLCLAVMIACTATVANAQNWGASPGVNYSYWYGYGSPGIYSSSIPYFSLFPPVYYSYHVSRTYGYSPFAYPPGVMTPGSEFVGPTIIQNVYPAGEGGETSSGRVEGPPPLRIDNPYVDQPDRRTGSDSRRSTDRHPQVVFPAAVARSER